MRSLKCNFGTLLTVPERLKCNLSALLKCTWTSAAFLFCFLHTLVYEKRVADRFLICAQSPWHPDIRSATQPTDSQWKPFEKIYYFVLRCRIEWSSFGDMWVAAVCEQRMWVATAS